MKTRITIRLALSVFCALLAAAPQHVSAQTNVNNTEEWVLIRVGNALINEQVDKQTKKMQAVATLQAAIAGEFLVMKGWEAKYNAYLKKAQGYAENIAAASTIYADGMEVLRNIYEIRKAIAANPEGIGATVAMNNIYVEVTAQFIETFNNLENVVKGGGKEHMLTGAERTQLLWSLSDNLRELNRRLRQMAISIAYHNMTDVWNKITSMGATRSHGQIAQEAFSRMTRAVQVSQILH